MDNENFPGSIVPPLVLLFIIKKFSQYYNVGINEYAVSRNSFKVIFVCKGISNAKKFIASVKKNYVYWSKRICGFRGCAQQRSFVIELFGVQQFVACSLEVLSNEINAPNIISSFKSHYSHKNTIRILCLRQKRELSLFGAVVCKARSNVGADVFKMDNNWNIIDLDTLINVDTSLIDSLFSFKTFKEIVNLRNKNNLYDI